MGIPICQENDESEGGGDGTNESKKKCVDCLPAALELANPTRLRCVLSP